MHACRAQVYTIYSILCIVFIILIIVTAFITVALTYFQLAVEDHRWWWRSFCCGGSTGAPPSFMADTLPVGFRPTHTEVSLIRQRCH